MTSENDVSSDPEWAWFKHERLHRAAASGDVETIRALLIEGCDINAFDKDLPRTALHYAVIEGKIEAVRFLLEAGADVNANDADRIGNTPLAQVADGCSLEMAEVLVEAGADPTIPGWMQLTAIDRSARRSDAEGPKVYSLLLDAAKRLKPDWPGLPKYGYVEQSPTDLTDPSGLQAIPFPRPPLIPPPPGGYAPIPSNALQHLQEYLVSHLIEVMVWCARKTGKEKSTDYPSWVDQYQREPNEPCHAFAAAALDDKYGAGNWDKGPGSEYNQIVKACQRGGLRK